MLALVRGAGLPLACAALAACPAASPPNSGATTGAGGGGGVTTIASASGGQGSSSTGGGGGSASDAGAGDLAAACTASCGRQKDIGPVIGCDVSPNCMEQCLADGAAAGSCLPQYVALVQCEATTDSPASCTCSATDQVTCPPCPPELAALQQCAGF